MMLKKFTKKDKRTNLEREIDAILVTITNMREMLDNSNSEELDDSIKSILESMSNVVAGSEEHLNMAKALDILYKAKASIKSRQEEYSEMIKNYNELCEKKDNQNELKRDIKKILITGSVYAVQVLLVLKHEEVNVISSKVFSRLPWVKL